MTFAELGSVANVSWGDTSVTKKSYVESGYQAYSAAGPDGFLPDFDFEEPGLVLSAIGARCGKCFKATGRWKAIKNTITITVSAGSKLDIDYLYYIVNDEDFWPKRGMAKPFIGLGDARKVQIPLPSIAEQKRIAGILDAADALRAQRRESLALLDTLLQSTFLDMFGDPVTNPMGWEVRELAEVVETGTIVTYGIVQAGDEYPGGVPYIRTGDLVDGDIELEGLRHTDPEIAAKFERSRVCAGEIVMSIRATVGTTAKVPSQLAGANLTQGTARISPGADTVPSFLLSFIRSQGSQAWLQRQVKGATFKEITLKRLRQMPIHVPPLDLQHRFAAIVQSVEQQKASQHAHLDELDTLFASLQSRAFRGDL